MQHIIRRQVLQLEISKELDPFQIQHAARRQYWEKIVKVLENFFDEISSDDEVINIDRLEINLGVFSEKDFENIDWSEQLTSKIMEQLRKSAGAKSVLQNSSRMSEPENIFSQWVFYLKNGWLHWNTIRVDNAWYDKILESLAVNYQCAEQLRMLISTDSKVVNRLISQHVVSFLIKIVALLTSENQKDLITAIDEIFTLLKFPEGKNEKIYIADKENFKKECWKQVLQIAAVKEKNSVPAIISEKLITANFSRDQIFQCSTSKFLRGKLKIILPVLDKLAAGQAWESSKTSEGKMIVAGKKEMKTNTSGREEIKTPAREEIKIIVAGGEEIKAKTPGRKETRGKNSENEEIKAGTSEKEKIEIKTSGSEKLKTKTPGSEKMETNSPGRNGIKIKTPGGREAKTKIPGGKETETNIPGKKEIKTKTPGGKERKININEEEPAGPGVFYKAKDENALPYSQRSETPPSIENIIDEQGVFAQNAGMVLLHPFLIRFFENLKLIKDGKFISDQKHQKALCLLHYLATGNTQVQEYELLIAKVLCAYPLQEPVSTKIKISKKEKNQADELLAAAIEHWKKLGSTSPATLRSEFLQRNGKLFTKNNNVYLQMESGSTDVLLDYLPWNISMIKLPWMKEILRVEWR
jgi:hypothetical protein